jgi:hypothetical protein
MRQTPNSLTTGCRRCSLFFREKNRGICAAVESCRRRAMDQAIGREGANYECRNLTALPKSNERSQNG